jgi:hypothetical protein
MAFIIGNATGLCPDNEVTRLLDAKPILRAAGDIVETRAPFYRSRADIRITQ